MPGDPSIQIVLELEGLSSEKGHVRLQDLLEQLQALKSALDSVDKQVDNTKKATLYYRVVDLTHSSPATITLEPVAKEKATRKGKINVQERHDRFFKELYAVSHNIPYEGMDLDTLDAFKRLVEGKDSKFAKAVIYNNAARIELDDKFKSNVEVMLRGNLFSEGTITGKLQALNVHGNPTFWIYPTHGPRRIYCTIRKSLKEKMLGCIDKLVRVRGKKAFRPFAHFPHRIDVTDFEEIPEPDTPIDLKSMRGSMESGESSLDQIERIRDEWD